ncbi:serine/threonine protein kinase [Rothia aerolata]|uniref:Serine/threonine protein kinase n=1 Tax=Rothia aerolata TaxID=1812262 RepID=A0A917IYB1_9MICC|nr:serine/threonine protein kinase [Rothia aerolata]GGH66637.1 hypothetical protein GCM10007359_20990 [Rothia aerolata]
MSQKPSHSIPLNTVLGERYKVTGTTHETPEGDSILEGKDQVLNRKVSIVVAAPEHHDRLIKNARTMATNARSTIQVLDLGNANGLTYLVTSHSRPEPLVDNLLVDSSMLAATSETQEALGQEIFGDEAPSRGSYTAGAAGAAAASPISATRAADAAPAAEDQDFADYSEYEDYPEERDFDDEDDDERRGSVWIVALAAILLLAAGVAAVFANLGGMVDRDASQEEAANLGGASSSASPSQSPSESPSASPSPTEEEKPEPKFGTVTRLVPSNQGFMADQDRTLGQMTDGNDSTAWMSYGFATSNFGGAAETVGLAYELEEKTTVSELTINQTSGSGGAFTVFTNDSASLDGATEVGSGSFTGEETKVELDQEKQGEGAQYVIVEFTEAPSLSQPIAGYNFGLRINEVSASN